MTTLHAYTVNARNCTRVFAFFILSSSGFHHLNIDAVINDENLKNRDELEIGKVCIILVYSYI